MYGTSIHNIVTNPPTEDINDNAAAAVAPVKTPVDINN